MSCLEKLLGELEAIYKTLEQIEGITQNQTTILLKPKADLQEEQDSLALIEGMVDYKDILIKELTAKEADFDKHYADYKGKITESSWIRRFQAQIQLILDKKEAITEQEKKNVMLLQTIRSERTKTEKLPINPKAVSNAYKKQGNLSSPKSSE